MVDEVKVGESHWLWYAEMGDGLLATLRPYHLAVGQQAFTQQRFDAMLGRSGLRYLALDLYSLEDGAPEQSLGADGIRVMAKGPGGRIESLRPSDLLEGSIAPADRVVLAPLLGPGPLPSLPSGSSLRLLVAMPTEAAVDELLELQVVLPRGERTLTAIEVQAEAYQEFLSGPSLETFRGSWRTRG